MFKTICLIMIFLIKAIGYGCGMCTGWFIAGKLIAHGEWYWWNWNNNRDKFWLDIYSIFHKTPAPTNN